MCAGGVSSCDEGSADGAGGMSSSFSVSGWLDSWRTGSTTEDNVRARPPTAFLNSFVRSSTTVSLDVRTNEVRRSGACGALTDRSLARLDICLRNCQQLLEPEHAVDVATADATAA